MKPTYKNLIFIAVCIYVFVIGILYLPHYFSLPTYVFPDSLSYISAAKKLYLHHQPDAIRPMGMASIVGVPLLFNAHFTRFDIWLFCLQSMLWLFTALLIYKTAKYVLEAKYAFIIATLFILNISNICFTAHVLTETIFTFILTLCMFYFVKYLQNKNQSNLVSISLLLCISCLIRPTTFYISILFGGFMLWFFIKNRKWKNVLIVCIGFGLIAFQMQKMKATFGNYTISYIDKLTTLTFLNLRAKEYSTHINIETQLQNVESQIKNISYPALTNFSNVEIAHTTTQHPLNVLQAWLFNIFENATASSAPIADLPISKQEHSLYVTQKIGKIISKLQNFFYSISAILILPYFYFFRKKYKLNVIQKNILRNAVFFCWYIIALSGISFWQKDRFHIVLVPVILICYAVVFHSIGLSKLLPTRAKSLQ